jgi:hypothetical protein
LGGTGARRFLRAPRAVTLQKPIAGRRENLMPFVVKAAVGSGPKGRRISFTEKTMYGGKEIRARDEIFVFDSDHQGGKGLHARGVVTSVEHGPGIRLTIEVRPLASARRNLGRAELKRFRDLDDGRPQTEIARKLYRQATNKIARISDRTAVFLNGYF